MCISIEIFQLRVSIVVSAGARLAFHSSLQCDGVLTRASGVHSTAFSEPFGRSYREIKCDREFPKCIVVGADDEDGPRRCPRRTVVYKLFRLLLAEYRAIFLQTSEEKRHLGTRRAQVRAAHAAGLFRALSLLVDY